MSEELLIQEDIVTVYNPCPKTTKAEVWKRADTLPERHGGDQLAFSIDCFWGNQLAVIHPGQQRKFVARAAKQFIEDHASKGLVILRDGEDPVAAACQGIQRAMDNFRGLGSEQIVEWQQGYSDEQWKKMRRQFKGICRNEAKERFLEEELDRLQSVGSTLGDDPNEMVEARCGTPVPRQHLGRHQAACKHCKLIAEAA